MTFSIYFPGPAKAGTPTVHTAAALESRIHAVPAGGRRARTTGPAEAGTPTVSAVSLFLSLFIFLFVSLAPPSAQAFPPAPPHTLYGTLRDEYGTPLSTPDARVLFETENGTKVETRVIAGLAAGINYEILVPMDAAIAPDLYRPNAMRPSVPFRLKVVVGNRTYLPIEMTGDMRALGQPAGSTRLDLTLGIDSDGDGIPDAYKDMVIAMMGGGLTHADIRPNVDLDGDGMTVWQEYIAGTYPWDPNDRLYLNILHLIDGKATLEFLAIEGRTYIIEASHDLTTWKQVPFRIPFVDAPGVMRAAYLAPVVRRLEAEVLSDPARPVAYRLGVQ